MDADITVAHTGDTDTNITSDSESATSPPSQVNVDTRRRKKHKKARRVTEPAETVTPSVVVSHDMKIPPFWPEKPAIWFAQVEGQFAIRNITDNNTKFYVVLSNLDRGCAAEIEDILISPPDYQRLKQELIKRLSVSRENKVKQLLMHEELGNRKPSQFLRHLQHLAGPSIPDDFLKTIWTSRLPTAMQPIIASQPTLSLDALAELADRVHDLAPSTHHVAAVATPSSSSSPSSSIAELTKQVSELTRQVCALTTMVNQRSRPRERSSQRHRERSTSRRSTSCYRRSPTCWYHKEFGAQARKCVKPCDYTSENTIGNQ